MRNMMKKSLLAMAVAIVSITALLPVWTEEAKKEEQKAETGRTQSEKDILIVEINSLKNQEMRATILQQLLNEEIAKLQQMEAVFCDRHNLDIKKYREMKYEYNADTGEFTEKKE